MSKRKRIRICIFLFLAGISSSYAQIDEQIDQLLEQDKADFTTVVYLVLVTSEHCEETESLSGVLGILANKNWEITVKGEEDTITLGEYSFLLMKAFNIPGGIMYMLIPGPRYATRELAYMKLIPEKPDPGRSVSGAEVMTILTRVLQWKEGK